MLTAEAAHTLDPFVAVASTLATHAPLPVVLGPGRPRFDGSTPARHAAVPVVVRSAIVATAAAFAVAIDGFPAMSFVAHQPTLRTATPFPAVLRVAQLATPLTAAAGPVVSE